MLERRRIMERKLKQKPDLAKRHYRRLSSLEIESIQTLAKKGLSLKRISAQLCAPKTTVYYHIREHCKKMTYLNLSVLPEKEQGYLVGMFVGDGSLIVKRKQGRYLTKFTLDAERDQDIANYLLSIFKKADKRITRYEERSSLAFKVYSKEFVEFLLKHVTYIKQRSSRRRMKILINPERWTTAFKLGFVSGLIDSDGHVYYNQRKTKYFGVLIKTANNAFRDQLIEILTTLGIEATTYTAKRYKKSYSRKPQYVVYISTQELKSYPRFLAMKLKRFSHS
jgi:hypothetical protein